MTEIEKTEQLLNEIELLRNKISELEKQSDFQTYSNDRLKHLAGFPESNPNPVIEIDSSKSITYFNNAAVNILKNHKLNEDMSRFFPDDIDDMVKQLSLGKKISYDRNINFGNNFYEERISLFPDLKVIRFYIIDITERLYTEKLKLWAFNSPIAPYLNKNLIAAPNYVLSCPK